MTPVLAMLLGSEAVASYPPTAPDLTALYVLVGTAVVGQLLGLGFGIVRWLGNRTVEREDKDKEALQASLEEHEETLQRLDRSIVHVQSEMKQMTAAIAPLQATVSNLAAHLETRLDKQSEHYQTKVKDVLAQMTEKLENLEYDLRQDTSRAIMDARTMASKRKRG